MKPARNPFLRSNRPVQINPYSPQARGLDHLWPLQGDHRNYVSQAQVAVEGAGNPPTRSWSVRGSHFNFTNDHFIGLAQPVSFGRTTPITISMWARAWSSGENDSKLFTIHREDAMNALHYIHIDADGGSSPTGIEIQFVWGEAQISSVATPAFVFDGTWQHVVVTFDPDDGVYGRARLWINASKEGTITGSIGVGDTTSTDIWIGYNHYLGDRRWEGDVSDIRIYGRVLGDNEIWQQYINPWDLYVRPERVMGLSPAAEEVILRSLHIRRPIQRRPLAPRSAL